MVTDVCTSREQSKRLLSLGITKNCADCAHFYVCEEHGFAYFWDTVVMDGNWELYWDVTDEEIPAWSMYRLLEIVDQECVIHLTNFTISGKVFSKHNNIYDNIIDCIEYLINNGYVNKDYLKQA